MAENTYIDRVSGVNTQKKAINASAGAGDANKIVALDSTGRLSSSMMPTGFAADTKLLPAAEGLAAGALINVFDDGGTISVRNADATGGIAKQCSGFVKDAYSVGDPATVFFEGINPALSGLTPGRVYLSATAGQVTMAPPSGVGVLSQQVGWAISATELSFEPQDGVVLA
mgnify:CR=1 FL=1